jgi:methylthioribose-1-phosphate isomerase
MHVKIEGGKDFRTVWMEGDAVHMIDQNKLPFEFDVFETPDVDATCRAIKDMTVRGAGAIGATAGYAMAQGFTEGNPAAARTSIEATRPTAQNLFYATKRVYEAGAGSTDSTKSARLEAEKLAQEDSDACESIGRHGARLIPEGGRVLTHCNAGWLAFVDWGSALSPVYQAHRSGVEVKVFADETQPRQQGGRLTAWELHNEGIEHEISPDTNMADLLEHERIDLVIVGADRIAANGDTANKIGTHVLAIVAKQFGVPFYVAAPTSTIDMSTADRRAIPIESRDPEEVQYKRGRTRDGRMEDVLVTNPGSPARNRAFDVTPADLITGIVTEKGIIRPSLQAIAVVKAAESPGPGVLVDHDMDRTARGR